ncbi:MAG: TonB-dependent receptor [Acidobacteriia bacterium]|nr:TonB-dependent receptor [Terriglobia bacterium]
MWFAGSRVRLCELFFCVIWLTGVVWAQSPEGALVVVVNDSNGGRVPGVSISVQAMGFKLERTAATNSIGEVRLESLPPGAYTVRADARGFKSETREIKIEVSSLPTLSFILTPASVSQAIQVRASGTSLVNQPIETTSSIEKSTIGTDDLEELPLAARSFANIAYLSPMTEPVEPSDPTKARITAVSFHGSSGLNVDLSVDGGDNNDDYIGGFLQNFSPVAIEEFTVRTAQYDADTGRTAGGSIIISTRRGLDLWHGDGDFYYRGKNLNARNGLDNPEPNPKQPFSRSNEAFALGGPIKKDRLWFFSSMEYVRENASVAYSQNSLDEFKALSHLASSGNIPGVRSIAVPTSVPVPFRDLLLSSRVDWTQSQRSGWFFRLGLDRNHTDNNLIQQGSLPSTGALTDTNYASLLVSNAFQFSTSWLGNLVLQGAGFKLTESRNSNLGLALAFPFTSTVLTTSGLETFGDNQFITGITNFPVLREQQKYQIRYDVSHATGGHALKFGVNFIHEPVLSGALAGSAETLVEFPHDPTFYAAHPAQFVADFNNFSRFTPAADHSFSQSVRRLGFYVQDSWRVRPNWTLNYGVRYDTTFGLFQAEGRDQSQNIAVITVNRLGLPLSPGLPHDYRKAFSPRLGLAYSPGGSQRFVIRAGAGIYYNDLAQNGWVEAFQAVNAPLPQNPQLLGRGDPGFLIDPFYKTPYAFQASMGMEKTIGENWKIDIHFEHVKGVHQYRRYEYIGGVTLPDNAPDLSVFRTDNRSRYDGLTFLVQHQLSNRFTLSAHYTLASAATWGATVGELFDYVNGVSDVRHPFGPGDYGPSGEDVRHRLVVAGTLQLPLHFMVSTLSQFESARPFTLTTPVDVNGDGLSTDDRAIINDAQTKLDQFRGAPFYQVDMRVTRRFNLGERLTADVFAEFFNLLNRSNPGNNFVTDISALPVPPNELSNVTHLCLNAACTSQTPLHSLDQLKQPAGALGDFFGPGTTVGIPFAAQIGVRVSF